MKPGNAEFLLVFRLHAPSMRCHASGELFLGGLWAGIAVRRLVRPANPTRLQYLRLGLWQFLAANRSRYAPDQALGALVSLQIAEIGRASSRERVGQYVLIEVVAVTIKKKQKNKKDKI